MDSSKEVTLDPEQRRVAFAPVEERLHVTAGPGSGKTETVSARIDHLMEEEGLEGRELLVISFSRAAVEAIQRRRRAAGPGPSTWVTTLDSLAARLLADEGVDLAGLSFEKRIRRTIELVEESGASGLMEEVRHVIVDEAQDVVGSRGKLVATLLAALPDDVGFTLLGDPLQGIYDFQLDEEFPDPDLLFAAARDCGATEVGLRGQYRAETVDARTAMALRGRADDRGWWIEMMGFTAGMPTVSLGGVAEQLTGAGDSVAILAQSNAQALVIAGELHRSGIGVELLPRAQDRPLATWLGQALGDAPASLDRAGFDAVVQGIDVETDEAWRLCRRLTRATSKYLDVRELAGRLAQGAAPIALTRDRASITVSTIHRAKGLEFDRVFLLDPNDWYGENDAAAARALYVALTRPRRRLILFGQPEAARFWKSDDRTERAHKSGWKGKGTRNFETRGSDWRGARPPGGEDPAAARAELEELLAAPGPVPVDIRLDPYRSTLRRPQYDAYVDDVQVGTLNDVFLEAFLSRLGKFTSPPILSGAHLTGVETVAGPPQDGPVGRNGLWLSPIIVGPLTLEWRHP